MRWLTAAPARIRLRGGTDFDLLRPEKSVFTINDIAHALSNLCRFTGHSSRFFSVAQHSVHVSYMVPRDLALEGLLHDAAEAFVGDCSTPLKSLLPEYRRIERRIDKVIRARFGLPDTEHPVVKTADERMLVAERHALMGCRAADPDQLLYPPMPPEHAKDLFTHRFTVLGGVE